MSHQFFPGISFISKGAFASTDTCVGWNQTVLSREMSYFYRMVNFRRNTFILPFVHMKKTRSLKLETHKTGIFHMKHYFRSQKSLWYLCKRCPPFFNWAVWGAHHLYAWVQTWSSLLPKSPGSSSRSSSNIEKHRLTRLGEVWRPSRPTSCSKQGKLFRAWC